MVTLIVPSISLLKHPDDFVDEDVAVKFLWSCSAFISFVLDPVPIFEWKAGFSWKFMNCPNVCIYAHVYTHIYIIFGSTIQPVWFGYVWLLIGLGFFGSKK